MNPGLEPGSRGLSRLPGKAVLWPLKKAALGGLRGLALPLGTRPPLPSVPQAAAGGPS